MSDVTPPLITIDEAEVDITAQGVLVIKAQSHRTQYMNRLDAYARLQDLVQRVALAPNPRRATHPTRTSKERRLQAKSQRSAIKELRGKR